MKASQRVEFITKIALGSLPSFDEDDLRMKRAVIAYVGFEPSMYEKGKVCLCAFLFNARTGHGGFWSSKHFPENEINKQMPMFAGMKRHIGEWINTSLKQHVTTLGTVCYDIQLDAEQLCG